MQQNLSIIRLWYLIRYSKNVSNHEAVIPRLIEEKISNVGYCVSFNFIYLIEFIY